MNKIATDHLAKLKAKVGPADALDADIMACRDRVNVAMAEFSRTWSEWQNLDASYGAKTDVLQGLLAELSATQIRQWDVAIQGVYLDDTPEYAELLPAGRGPFQSAAIEEKVQAVKTLGERLGKFSQLSVLKKTVKDFHTKLKTARDTQKGEEGGRDSASNDAETARVELAAALFANVGRLMEKHSKESYRIEDYYDLALIRQTAPAPVAPAPSAPAAGGENNQAGAVARTLESATPSNGASSTLVTEVTPRSNGNGSHERATV